MTIRFDEHAFGLVTDKQRHVNKMLQQENPRLSLRRVPTSDPGFTPEKPYGVYEEVGPGVRPWVFFLSESMIDERVLARVLENDLSKQGVPARMAKMIALSAATEKTMRDRDAEIQAARNEEALFVAQNAGRTTIRMKVDGDDIIIGDDPSNHRSPRTFIV